MRVYLLDLTTNKLVDTIDGDDILEILEKAEREHRVHDARILSIMDKLYLCNNEVPMFRCIIVEGDI